MIPINKKGRIARKKLTWFQNMFIYGMGDFVHFAVYATNVINTLSYYAERPPEFAIGYMVGRIKSAIRANIELTENEQKLFALLAEIKEKNGYVDTQDVKEIIRHLGETIANSVETATFTYQGNILEQEKKVKIATAFREFISDFVS